MQKVAKKSLSVFLMSLCTAFGAFAQTQTTIFTKSHFGIDLSTGGRAFLIGNQIHMPKVKFSIGTYYDYSFSKNWRVETGLRVDFEEFSSDFVLKSMSYRQEAKEFINLVLPIMGQWVANKLPVLVELGGAYCQPLQTKTRWATEGAYLSAGVGYEIPILADKAQMRIGTRVFANIFTHTNNPTAGSGADNQLRNVWGEVYCRFR